MRRRPNMRVSLRRRELLLAAGLCLIGLGASAAPLAVPRRLKLKNVNTGETFEGTYRDGEGPIAAAMADLVQLLRDHHVNKTGPLDITALDFLADVMNATGQGGALVLSAY